MKPTGTKTALEPVEADRLIELEAIIDAGMQTFSTVGTALLQAHSRKASGDASSPLVLP
jgi:hypothetical protein